MVRRPRPPSPGRRPPPPPPPPSFYRNGTGTATVLVNASSVSDDKASSSDSNESSSATSIPELSSAARGAVESVQILFYPEHQPQERWRNTTDWTRYWKHNPGSTKVDKHPSHFLRTLGNHMKPLKDDFDAARNVLLGTIPREIAKSDAFKTFQAMLQPFERFLISKKEPTELEQGMIDASEPLLLLSRRGYSQWEANAMIRAIGVRTLRFACPPRFTGEAFDVGADRAREIIDNRAAEIAHVILQREAQLGGRFERVFRNGRARRRNSGNRRRGIVERSSTRRRRGSNHTRDDDDDVSSESSDDESQAIADAAQRLSLLDQRMADSRSAIFYPDEGRRRLSSSAQPTVLEERDPRDSLQPSRTVERFEEIYRSGFEAGLRYAARYLRERERDTFNDRRDHGYSSGNEGTPLYLTRRLTVNDEGDSGYSSPNQFESRYPDPSSNHSHYHNEVTRRNGDRYYRPVTEVYTYR